MSYPTLPDIIALVTAAGQRVDRWALFDHNPTRDELMLLSRELLMAGCTLEVIQWALDLEADAEAGAVKA